MLLCWNAIKALLVVEDETVRHELQEQAATQGWSVSEVQRQVRLRVGKQSKAGRRFVPPESAEARLLRLAEEAARLKRFIDAAVTARDSAVAKATPGRKQADRDRQVELLERSLSSIEDLQESLLFCHLVLEVLLSQHEHADGRGR